MTRIEPRERVGTLAFGMTRAETRAALGAGGEMFRRAPHEPTASELYAGAGLVLSFDLDGRLHAVEMSPHAEPALHGVPLTGRPLDEVSAGLRAAGVTPRPESGGLVLPELGVVVSAGSVLASVSDHVVFTFDFFPGDPPPVSPTVIAAGGFAPGVRLGGRSCVSCSARASRRCPTSVAPARTTSSKPASSRRTTGTMWWSG